MPCKSEKRLVVGIGLKNLVIIETDDALLVSDKCKSQDIKDVVLELKNEKYLKDNNIKIYRPWGNYTSWLKMQDGK